MQTTPNKVTADQPESLNLYVIGDDVYEIQFCPWWPQVLCQLLRNGAVIADRIRQTEARDLVLVIRNVRYTLMHRYGQWEVVDRLSDTGKTVFACDDQADALAELRRISRE